MDGLHRGGIILDGIILHPITTVVPFNTWVNAPVIVARKEGFITLALAFEGFQLAGYIDGTVTIVADIKRNHADGVAGNEELVALLVVEHEGKDAVEVFEEIDALLTIECKNHLAVAARLELVLTCITATNLLVVINLAIHSQHLLTVW